MAQLFTIFRKLRASKAKYLFIGHPWLKPEDKINFKWNLPVKIEDKIRSKTFGVLWKRNFYITSGKN